VTNGKVNGREHSFGHPHRHDAPIWSWRAAASIYRSFTASVDPIRRRYWPRAWPPRSTSPRTSASTPAGRPERDGMERHPTTADNRDRPIVDGS
jgi:hypothetical protein